MPSNARPALRRLAQLALLIAALLGAGTAGFALTEHMSPWNGFLLALDTVATVGSMRAPTDTPGELVKVTLIVLGVGTLFYGLVTVTELFVSGHLGDLLSERRARRMTERLTDHHIICGFGRVGQQVARDLRTAGVPYVIIDHDPANRDHVDGVGVRFIVGKPSDDDALRDAGIDRARGIIACVDSDAENIFTCLSARELRPDIVIVARASQEDAESKLRRAGADRVISPYKSSGSEMARLALHPNVSGTLDVAAEYRLEEIEVSGGCAGAGQPVEQVRGGAFIVAVRRGDGSVLPQPPAETLLQPGDTVMAMGTPRTLERLERVFEGDGRPAARA